MIQASKTCTTWRFSFKQKGKLNVKFKSLDLNSVGVELNKWEFHPTNDFSNSHSFKKKMTSID